MPRAAKAWAIIAGVSELSAVCIAGTTTAGAASTACCSADTLREKVLELWPSEGIGHRRRRSRNFGVEQTVEFNGTITLTRISWRISATQELWLITCAADNLCLGGKADGARQLGKSTLARVRTRQSLYARRSCCNQCRGMGCNHTLQANYIRLSLSAVPEPSAH